MMMDPNQTGKFITLDWDDISIDEAKKRFYEIIDNNPNVRKLVLSLSALSGFHVRMYLYHSVNIALTRRYYRDDGNRIVNDLLNRPNHINNILWRRKKYAGTVWEEKHLITYDGTYQHG